MAFALRQLDGALGAQICRLGSQAKAQASLRTPKAALRAALLNNYLFLQAAKAGCVKRTIALIIAAYGGPQSRDIHAYVFQNG